MKKTLAILTLVVMLAALIVPVAMAEENDVVVCRTCSHSSVGVRVYRFNIDYVNTTHHESDQYTQTICKLCDAILSTSAITYNVLEKHYGSNNPAALNHVVGSNTHRAKAYCSLCSGLYYFTFTCYGDGTNCAIPF